MFTVDARCDCLRCRNRTEDSYRMIGTCRNCGTDDILIVYRKGDHARDVDCPVCGNRRVHSRRLAIPDEIPLGEESE